jgi:hypothetical protein
LIFKLNFRTWVDLIQALKSHLTKALVPQAIKHKLIKIPIKPVNSLIRLTQAKNSNKNKTNEDNEQNTLLKLFGSKLQHNINDGNTSPQKDLLQNNNKNS